ncbi:MAG: alkane 1-monooxygenase [Pseudomonadales bacterium]|nr:alkane 1-monooxygenase [Pseudomonadales bacterium]
MLRYLRFYVAPITIMAISCAMLFSHYWLWVPALAYIGSIALLDQLFPHDIDEKSYRYPFFLDLALYLSTPATIALYVAIFWVAGSGSQDALGLGALVQSMTGIDVIEARNSTAWYHYVLMFLAVALPATGAGGLAGHELTHRTSRPFDLWIGRITMAFNWGIAFPIEHVYGHHSYVGTKKDPATAARGDSVYQHLPKAMYRTVTNAWEIESERLRKIGASFFSYKNVLLRMGAVAALTTLFAYYCAGWQGVLFHLIVCVSTKVALEVLNYVEHYGLIRQPEEAVQPRHSWNCNHVVSGVFTYNLTRHSHHHADAQVPYQDLRSHSEQPEMPGGLMSAYLSTLIPPLWRKKIVPKLLEWDRAQASSHEYPLIAEANIESGWHELHASIANETERAEQPIEGHVSYS